MRYRHKWSASVDSTWQWADLGKTTDPKATARSVAMEITMEKDHSEHYRGIDYEIVVLPPREVLVRMADEEKMRARRHEKRAAKLMMMAKKARAKETKVKMSPEERRKETLERQVMRAIYHNHGYSTVRGLVKQVRARASIHEIRRTLKELYRRKLVWWSGGGGPLPREWRLTANGMGEAAKLG
jgi:hypothetical protein